MEHSLSFISFASNKMKWHYQFQPGLNYCAKRRSFFLVHFAHFFAVRRLVVNDGITLSTLFGRRVFWPHRSFKWAQSFLSVPCGMKATKKKSWVEAVSEFGWVLLSLARLHPRATNIDHHFKRQPSILDENPAKGTGELLFPVLSSIRTRTFYPNLHEVWDRLDSDRRGLKIA